MRGSRAATVALATLGAAAAMVLPAPRQAHAEEVHARPADGVFVMDGHGWGHGRGLNQWGAQGAALNGVGHLQILAAYYPGTTQQTIADKPIRVLLDDDTDEDVQVRTVPGRALRVTDVHTNVTYPLSSAYPRWRAYHDGSVFRLKYLSGSTWVTFAPGGKSGWAGALRFSATDANGVAAQVRVHFPNGSARDYRGTVSAVRTSGAQVATVNTLTLEHYLYGVVPRESPTYFHTEALRAQAVAARSYSAYKRGHVASTARWDICSTTQCQVYSGVRHISSGGTVTEQEGASTTAAVNATRQQVRWYDGGPIFAEFSSSNGGWSTAHSTFPYLAARRDDWDALKSPSHKWVGRVTVGQIEARYPSLGRLVRLRVISRDGNGEWGGRVKRVILEGVRADGTATSVEATGGGIYLANPWAGGSHTGPRGSWWKIRSGTASAVVAQSAAKTLVRPPGSAVTETTVDMRNTGTTAWQTSGLHLAKASPPGGADALVGGSTKPGSFVGNLDRAGATTVAPGERARFRVRFDLSAQAAGTYTPAYQVRLGSGQIFGATVRWTLSLVEPVFKAGFVTALPPPGTTVPAGHPMPVQGRTVVLPRSGAQVVRLAYRNTGNVAWPVGGPVQLGTSNPRNRTSGSAGESWLRPERPGALVDSQTRPGSTSVQPGDVGLFEFTMYGNGHPAGTTRGWFEPVWNNRAWLGSPVELHVVRTDPAVQRLAELNAPVAAVHALHNQPDSTRTLVLRLRNLGSQPWALGTSERLATSPAGRDSRFRTSQWASAELGGALLYNRSRRNTTAVHPGEIGEWHLPLGATRVPAGDYVEAFQAVRSDGRRFGPVVSTTVRVSQATVAGTVVSAPPRWSMSRTGSKTVSIDVRNTGNVAWPVQGGVRSAALSGSGSASGWITPQRPSSVTANVTVPGASSVAPGHVARFTFVMAANNRAAGSYTEAFGVLWEGYAWTGVRVPISFTLV